MLSFDEIDNIVIKNLDCLDPEIYQVTRDPRGQSNLYTVTVKKSGRLLGRYRVEKRPDGGVNYGSIQGDSPEWDLIWESMLNRTLVRAGGKMTESTEQDYQRRQDAYLKQVQEREENEKAQPVNISGDTQAGTVTHFSNEQGQTIITGGTLNPGYKIEIGQKSITFKPERAEYEVKTESALLRHNGVEVSQASAAKPLLENWKNDYSQEAINTTSATQDGGAKPNTIPEDTTGWDTTLVEMWNKGYSRDEIANRVNVSKDRVTNRVTELRNKFGENTVPYNKDRKKRLIKS